MSSRGQRPRSLDAISNLLPLTRREASCGKPPRMAQNDSSSSRGPAWLAIVWPLLTGLAVGFLVGREVGNRGSGGSGESAAVTGKAPAGTKMPAKVYKSENEFPEGWTKSADL